MGDVMGVQHVPITERRRGEGQERDVVMVGGWDDYFSGGDGHGGGTMGIEHYCTTAYRAKITGGGGLGSEE